MSVISLTILCIIDKSKVPSSIVWYCYNAAAENNIYSTLWMCRVSLTFVLCTLCYFFAGKWQKLINTLPTFDQGYLFFKRNSDSLTWSSMKNLWKHNILPAADALWLTTIWRNGFYSERIVKLTVCLSGTKTKIDFCWIETTSVCHDQYILILCLVFVWDLFMYVWFMHPPCASSSFSLS